MKLIIIHWSSHEKVSCLLSKWGSSSSWTITMLYIGPPIRSIIESRVLSMWQSNHFYTHVILVFILNLDPHLTSHHSSIIVWLRRVIDSFPFPKKAFMKKLWTTHIIANVSWSLASIYLSSLCLSLSKQGISTLTKRQFSHMTIPPIHPT
jgi:hypothetical protein